MCGIYGHFNPHGPGDAALVARMAACLAHRGPDGDGDYVHGPLAFGAVRLAIIDLAAGVMPIFNEDRSVAVVFNGEIYNYRALRDELRAMGHVFATGTDTEVLVHGYEAWGDAVIERLRGMFALCIWDQRRERLLLARDRLGEKPLYYAQVGGEFVFASEIKALLLHPRLERAVNPDALLAYLTLGYVPPPDTMFAGVHKLAPGERLVVGRGQFERSRYWEPVLDTLTPPEFDYDGAVRAVRQMVFDCVEMRLMSDVPLGVFLSGGVDSSAVAAIVARAVDRPVQSFTVGFRMSPGSHGDQKFNVDARFAREMAEHLGTDHHEIQVQEESLAALFPHLIYAMDEPVAQPAIIQTAYVAALARLSGVPVLLSGDASDELFAGYTAYRADRVVDRYLRLPALLRKPLITPLLARLPVDRLRKLAHKSRMTDPAARYLEWKRMFAPERLPALLVDGGLAGRAFDTVAQTVRPMAMAPRTRSFADRIAFTSLKLWIAEDSNMRVDKMTMAMSVEARAPFEDHHLVAQALGLPLGYKLRQGDFKRVLKDAVRDLVPSAILDRPKWGFVPPSSDWLRTTLRPLVDAHLSRERIAATGFFQPDAVQCLVDDHMTKRSYELWSLWPLLVFQIWHALYIDGSLALDHPLRPEDLRSGIQA